MFNQVELVQMFETDNIATNFYGVSYFTDPPQPRKFFPSKKRGRIFFSFAGLRQFKRKSRSEKKCDNHY